MECGAERHDACDEVRNALVVSEELGDEVAKGGEENHVEYPDESRGYHDLREYQ